VPVGQVVRPQRNAATGRIGTPLAARRFQLPAAGLSVAHSACRAEAAPRQAACRTRDPLVREPAGAPSRCLPVKPGPTTTMTYRARATGSVPAGSRPRRPRRRSARPAPRGRSPTRKASPQAGTRSRPGRALLDKAPPGSPFTEDGPPYAGPDRGAPAWAFGPGGDPRARGVDVITVGGGRISAVLTLLTA
jgi:hypothetical protein